MRLGEHPYLFFCGAARFAVAAADPVALVGAVVLQPRFVLLPEGALGCRQLQVLLATPVIFDLPEHI